MLCYAHLEPVSDFHPGTPPSFPTNRRRRPRIQSVRNILAENKRRSPEENQPSQLRSGKRPHLHVPRQHISGKRIAGRIFAAELSRIGGAKIRIRLIVRRSNIKLAITPDEIPWKKESSAINRWRRTLLRDRGRTQNRQQQGYREDRFHEGSIRICLFRLLLSGSAHFTTFALRVVSGVPH